MGTPLNKSSQPAQSASGVKRSWRPRFKRFLAESGVGLTCLGITCCLGQPLNNEPSIAPQLEPIPFATYWPALTGDGPGKSHIEPVVAAQANEERLGEQEREGRRSYGRPLILKYEKPIDSKTNLVEPVEVKSLLPPILDPYTSEFEKAPRIDFYYRDKLRAFASARQETFRTRVAIPDAVGEDVPYAYSRVSLPGTRSVSAEAEAGVVRIVLLFIATVILAVVVLFRLLMPDAFRAFCLKYVPTSLLGSVDAEFARSVRAEEEVLNAFLVSFKAGPEQTRVRSATDLEEGVVGRFSLQATQLIARQRAMLQEVERVEADVERLRIIADLGREVHAFVGEASGCLAAWQLASALEGLLKQLASKASNITRSTLRTVGGALDLLEKLCRPEIRNDLLTKPPIRFLAVDDDLICRTAVSNALRKALHQPDLANDGNMALTMAGRHPYDAVFLDVQMPGMDGFELCTKIHETSLNRDVPVVFVTCLSDFDAHARSLLSGGIDLIAKPFLTFEITVKALTLVLNRRLRAAVAVADTNASASPTSNQQSQIPAAAKPNSVATFTDARELAIKQSGVEFPQINSIETAFLKRASRGIEPMQALGQTLSEATTEDARQEALAQIYLGLHVLQPQVDSASSHPGIRLCDALEGLLKKLLESPTNWTASAAQTVAEGLELLHEMCSEKQWVELAADARVRILVVDDDMFSRRALESALQMTVGKPMSVEGGAAALDLATSKAFDAIFMDVQMPGMDGFTAGQRIQKTVFNAATPIVFVTGQCDFAKRQQLATRFGSDVIAKPFLTAEVSTKALTVVMRHRLRLKQDALASVPSAASAKPSPAASTAPESARERRRRRRHKAKL